MFKKLLIANRGEIAIRIMRSANNLGIETVAIYSSDDAGSLHVHRADEAVCLEGQGVSAYLDIEQIVNIAMANDCEALHPGYGLLSENPELAEACHANGITFVGPTARTLTQFGDKSAARRLAREHGIPILEGTEQATSLSEARAFMATQSGRPIIIKAVSGGGGERGGDSEAARNLGESRQNIQRAKKHVATADARPSGARRRAPQSSLSLGDPLLGFTNLVRKLER